MKHTRVYRLCALSIAICMVVGMIPIQSAAVMDTATIQSKMDSYYNTVVKSGKLYWNGNIRSNESKLKAAVDQGDYVMGLTGKACVCGDKKHANANGCTSNTFGGAAQCHGFSKYLCYVIFGSYPAAAAATSVSSGRVTDANWSYYTKDRNSYPGLQPGDMIRYWNSDGKQHTAVVYSVSPTGSITVVDCNSSSAPCKVFKRITFDLSANALTEATFKSYYDNNKAYICRYAGVAKSEPVAPTPPYTAYVSGTDGSLVINSKPASGNKISTIPEGAPCTVYPDKTSGNWYFVEYKSVQGYAYKVYLTTTVPKQGNHTHTYNDYGICTGCGETFDLQISTVRKRMVTARTNGADVPAHSEPYGAASITRRLAAKDDKVTVVAQTTNAFGNLWYKTSDGDWIVYDYLKEAEADSFVKLTVQGVSSVTTSSARLDASCEYVGTRPSSVGVYLGTSMDSMSKWDFDAINHTKNPFNIWYTLTDLSGGTTYYYKFYAIVDGKETVSEAHSFTTNQEPIPGSVNLSIADASNVTASSARLDASCAYSGTRPSSVGVYLGTSMDSMSKWGSDAINHTKNPFNIWYTLTDLSGGTTYYYKFYAIVDGKEIASDTRSFTTSTMWGGTSLSVMGATISDSSVRLDATCTYSGSRPSSVGVYLGTSLTTMSKWDSDAISHNKNPFNIWYTLTGLSAKTTYYYQFYAVVDGLEVLSYTNSFTTN